MHTKKWIGGVLALGLVLTVGLASTQEGGMLQGKFKGTAKDTTVKDSLKGTEVSTVNPFLTLSNSMGVVKQTIELSDIDFDWTSSFEGEADPAAFALAGVDMSFASGAQNCTSTYWEFLLTDGGSYENFMEQVFSSAEMDFRDSATKFWYTKVAAKNSSLTQYKLDALTLKGSTYSYYVNGTVNENMDPSLLDTDFTLYVQNVCVSKDGTDYNWEFRDSHSENKYFAIEQTDSYGFKVGTVRFEK